MLFCEYRRLHVRVTGQVQGVGFRFSALRSAQAMGIVGFVRNCADGSVELVAEGPHEQLEKFLTWCGKGPCSARVKKVYTQWDKAKGEFDKFSIHFF